jgi:uncharacterized protein YcfJ
MRLRFFARTLAACSPLAAALAFASPALAHDGHHHMPPPGVVDAEGRVYDDSHPDTRPEWRGDRGPAYSPEYTRARENWLAECRRRNSDDGVGGALIGGVVGGVLGNRIAGRHDRTLGTVAGAAVGAIAGAAIDKSEDRGRSRDYCESYLDSYSAPSGSYGYGQAAYGYGYAAPMMMVMVPAQAPMRAQKRCTETVVTEEWVPVRQRYIPRRAPARRVIHDKRVRITPVPDKRIPVR